MIDAMALAADSSAAAAWSYASIGEFTIIINILIIRSYNYNILNQNMKDCKCLLGQRQPCHGSATRWLFLNRC